MKKNLLFLFAILMASVISANAAEIINTTARSNAMCPIEVKNKDVTVVIDLTDGNHQLFVPYIATIGGSWLNPTIANWAADNSQVEGLPLNASVTQTNGKTIATVNVTSDMWGDPVNGEYRVSIGFPDIYYMVDGEPVEPLYPVYNEDGDIEDGISSEAEICLMIPDDAPAKYVGVYPSAEEMEGMTIGELYESGMMGFLFSNEVNCENLVGTVTYVADGDPYEYDIFDYDIFADWTRDGKFMICVFFPELEDVDIEDLESITVHVENVTTMSGNTISVPDALFENRSVRKSPSTAGINFSKMIDAYSEGNVSVYSLEGTLIRNITSSADFSSLKSGVYVINGKKVIIR